MVLIYIHNVLIVLGVLDSQSIETKFVGEDVDSKFKLFELKSDENYKASDRCIEIFKHLDYFKFTDDLRSPGPLPSNCNLITTNNVYSSLMKFLRLMNLYKSNEAIVDHFVFLLLLMTGFHDGPLSIIPQLNMDLNFGSSFRNGDRCSAKPDYIIFNLVSNIIVAVIEDKNFDSTTTVFYSEAQLAAAALASFQRYPNAFDFIGIRVNGSSLFFYYFSKCELLLNALVTQKSPVDSTFVKRFSFSAEAGFDFTISQHLKIIIETLDLIISNINFAHSNNNYYY